MKKLALVLLLIPVLGWSQKKKTSKFFDAGFYATPEMAFPKVEKELNPKSNLCFSVGSILRAQLMDKIKVSAGLAVGRKSFSYSEEVAADIDPQSGLLNMSQIDYEIRRWELQFPVLMHVPFINRQQFELTTGFYINYKIHDKNTQQLISNDGTTNPAKEFKPDHAGATPELFFGMGFHSRTGANIRTTFEPHFRYNLNKGAIHPHVVGLRLLVYLPY